MASSASASATQPFDGASVRFLWLDLEMTGLDEDVDNIIEVAVVVTATNDFTPLASYHAVVRPSTSALQSMGDFVRAMHTKTGLLERLDSDDAKQAEVVEQELLEVLSGCTPSSTSRVLLCGNSVHVDRRFIRRYWPQLERRLHYRIVDVSSWKEVFSSQFGVWYPKRNTHSAVDDVQESIAEMDFFLSFIDHSRIQEERRRRREQRAARHLAATPGSQ